MNLDAIEKHHEQWPQVKQERCMSKLYKPQSWWVKTHKCYNCEKLRHLARTCKKSQRKRKEVEAMNTHIVHNALSWTVCYDNMCWAHMSSKDEAEWYSQKLKKKQNGYNTTGWPKGLAILKKVKIKETDTHGTQIEENYSNSTWTALNLNRLRRCWQLRSQHKTQNEIWALWESALKDASTTARKTAERAQKGSQWP